MEQEIEASLRGRMKLLSQTTTKYGTKYAKEVGFMLENFV